MAVKPITGYEVLFTTIPVPVGLVPCGTISTSHEFGKNVSIQLSTALLLVTLFAVMLFGKPQTVLNLNGAENVPTPQMFLDFTRQK